MQEMQLSSPKCKWGTHMNAGQLNHIPKGLPGPLRSQIFFHLKKRGLFYGCIANLGY